MLKTSNSEHFDSKMRALPKSLLLLSVVRGGSVNRTVYAFNVDGGPIIRAGCFHGYALLEKG